MKRLALLTTSVLALATAGGVKPAGEVVCLAIHHCPPLPCQVGHHCSHQHLRTHQ